MKAVLDIPDDLAAELERQAKLSGRPTSEQLVHLMRLAILVEDMPLAEMTRFAGVILALRDLRNRASHGGTQAIIRTDSVTGLPVIDSPPDAPIRSMTNEQILSLIEQTQLEEDMERAGVTLRH